MDSDDTIDETNGRKLRELAYGQHEPSVFGYVMQVHCPAYDAAFSEEATIVDHVKLFRNDPRLRFEGRIHEQVLMPIRRIDGDVRWTDIFVVHSGADNSEEGRRKKYERDLRILQLDLNDRPDHPFVLFNFGMTYNDMGRHEEAIQWLTRCLQRSDPGESHVRKAYALLIASLMQLKQHDHALRISQQGLKFYPDDAELLFRQGMLFHELGQLDEAISSYRKLLDGNDDRHFSSIDRSIRGYKPRHNLAVAYEDAGRPDLAEIQWREAIVAGAGQIHAWQSLGDLLLRQQMYSSADVVADAMLRREGLRPGGIILKARVTKVASARPTSTRAGKPIGHCETVPAGKPPAR